MSTLYRKVLCSDRLPNCGDCYLTSVGECYLDKKNYWICNLDGIIPEWWFEEITIPTDEEIEKVGLNQAKDILTPNTATGFYSGYINGFKEALELLAGGKP